MPKIPAHPWALAAGVLFVAVVLATFILLHDRATSPVSLGVTERFAVLAGSAVDNTGASVIRGDIGVSPGSRLTGFPTGARRTLHVGDDVASRAQDDLRTAYDDAAGRSSSGTISGDLAGSTLTSGVFTAAGSLRLSGDLRLDARGNRGAVFIFQAGSTLNVVSGSRVLLVNGAQVRHVWWQVGGSATIGRNSEFAGNIVALTSISMQAGVTLRGRAMARNGAVALDTDTISP